MRRGKRALWLVLDGLFVLNVVERLIHGPASGLSGRLLNDVTFFTAGVGITVLIVGRLAERAMADSRDLDERLRRLERD
jgi:hypothetical protein